jgi:hypothetical protein
MNAISVYCDLIMLSASLRISGSLPNAATIFAMSTAT